jgi:Mn-dependent DtxR family transcriptional regulator
MSEEYSLRDTVFREFLKNPTLGPAEMATKINAKYNSVKAAYAKLAEDGLLQRTGRGNYEPNYGWITISILDRLEKLEKGVK